MMPDLLLKDVTAADVAAGRWMAADIRITGGKISAVGPGLTPEGARVVRCEGAFAVPGMIDGHIHLRASGRIGPTEREPVPGGERAETADRTGLISRLHSFLFCGVTSIYDAGNDPAVILGLRGAEHSAQIASPRIFCSGSLLTCPGGHGSGGGIATHIRSLPADTEVLEEYLGSEPDIVKITYDEHNWGIRPLIPILPPQLLAAIIRFCHDRMRRVTVHVSNELRAREAVEAGADALAHPVIQSPVTDEFIWLLAAKQIPVVSTLAIGERYPRLADHPEFVDAGLYADCLSPTEREQLRTAESARQRENRWADWMRVMTPVAQENLRRLVAAGGTVVTGTDLSLGADYHRELELLQDAGIGPWDVLRCATVNAAAFLGRSGELGVLAPGHAADLVLLEADPAADVGNLAAIRQVYKAGEPVDRAALDLPGAVHGTVRGSQ
jgi:imidazolonepropionase-like amidohydrolase